MVWLFALAAVGAGIGASYAASGLGQKAAAAVYFAIVALGGFASTYLTAARVRGAVAAFLAVGAIAAVAYFLLVDSFFRTATTAVANDAQTQQAGASFGRFFGIVIGAVVFLETIVAGITGAVIGAKVKVNGGLPAVARAAS